MSAPEKENENEMPTRAIAMSLEEEDEEDMPTFSTEEKFITQREKGEHFTL